MGHPVSPLDVVVNGTRHLHAVGRGLAHPEGILIDTLDAALVVPGQLHWMAQCPSTLKLNHLLAGAYLLQLRLRQRQVDLLRRPSTMCLSFPGCLGSLAYQAAAHEEWIRNALRTHLEVPGAVLQAAEVVGVLLHLQKVIRALVRQVREAQG